MANDIEIVATSVGLIDVDVVVDATIPNITIETAQQGPEGKQGNPGAPGQKGDKGDSLTYGTLTVAEKQDIVSTYDQVVGNTSYTNIFLNTLIG